MDFGRDRVRVTGQVHLREQLIPSPGLQPYSGPQHGVISETVAHPFAGQLEHPGLLDQALPIDTQPVIDTMSYTQQTFEEHVSDVLDLHNTAESDQSANTDFSQRFSALETRRSRIQADVVKLEQTSLKFQTEQLQPLVAQLKQLTNQLATTTKKDEEARSYFLPAIALHEQSAQTKLSAAEAALQAVKNQLSNEQRFGVDQANDEQQIRLSRERQIIIAGEVATANNNVKLFQLTVEEAASSHAELIGTVNGYRAKINDIRMQINDIESRIENIQDAFSRVYLPTANTLHDDYRNVMNQIQRLVGEYLAHMSLTAAHGVVNPLRDHQPLPALNPSTTSIQISTRR